MTPKEKRIRRLRNQIARTQARLAACKSGGRHKSELMAIVSACDKQGQDFDELVDRVVDFLDKKIKPGNPLLEWLSDVGVDIAAFAAVTIYKGTQARLRRRLKRAQATLERLIAE